MVGERAYRSRRRTVGIFDQLGSPGAFVFILVVLAVSFVLLKNTSRYFSRQRQEQSSWSHTARPLRDGSMTAQSRLGGISTAASATSERHSDATSEMDRWEVEMHETARKLKAQLDSKMRALQALIADADRAASRLEAASKKENNPDNTPNTPPSIRIKPGGSPLFNPDNGALPIGEKKRSASPANQAEALRSAPVATASRVSPQHRQEEIYSLADRGLSDSAVAQRLSMPIGEVELILSLRSKR
jgi:hypothetical protein